MKAYLMTRGTARRLDYNFLGTPPQEYWWDPLADRNWIVLEQPEIVLRSRGRSASLLLSGIPSRRRDVIGTVIRYTLVIEGVDGDAGLAVRLVADGLDTDGRGALGALLDGEFDAAKVDAILGGEGEQRDVGPAVLRLLRAYRKRAPRDVPAREDTAREDIAGSWVGSLSDGAARDAFLARAARLVNGEEGVCFATHALASTQGAGRAHEGLGTTVAILLCGTDLGRVYPLGKALPSRRDRALAMPGRRGLLLPVAILCGTGLLILLLLLTL